MAVVVKVSEEGRPAPVRHRHPRQATGFGESTVTPVEVEHIPHRLVVEAAGQIKVQFRAVIVGHQ